VRGAADTVDEIPIPLTIRAHGVSLTEEDINAVLMTATDILRKQGIFISFELNNTFDSHKVIDEGKVNGCDDFKEKNLLNTQDVNVHILDKIPCCGYPDNKKETIVGCSGFQKAMIVLPVDQPNDPKSLEMTALQWMHEFGHRLGLCHNICDDGSIMTSPIGFKDRLLDDCEKNVFGGGKLADPICILPDQKCTPTGPACKNIPSFEGAQF
jgi:hypothetical protein